MESQQEILTEHLEHGLSRRHQMPPSVRLLVSDHRTCARHRQLRTGNNRIATPDGRRDGRRQSSRSRLLQADRRRSSAAASAADGEHPKRRAAAAAAACHRPRRIRPAAAVARPATRELGRSSTYDDPDESVEDPDNRHRNEEEQKGRHLERPPSVTVLDNAAHCRFGDRATGARVGDVDDAVLGDDRTG